VCLQRLRRRSHSNPVIVGSVQQAKGFQTKQNVNIEYRFKSVFAVLGTVVAFYNELNHLTLRRALRIVPPTMTSGGAGGQPRSDHAESTLVDGFRE
jgi:hypothetical protein